MRRGANTASTGKLYLLAICCASASRLEERQELTKAIRSVLPVPQIGRDTSRCGRTHSHQRPCSSRRPLPLPNLGPNSPRCQICVCPYLPGPPTLLIIGNGCGVDIARSLLIRICSGGAMCNRASIKRTYSSILIARRLRFLTLIWTNCVISIE